jgi:histidinol-phosphate aminotransferase
MIDELVRKQVKGLSAYSEGGRRCAIKLDANENAWGLPRDIANSVIEDIKGFDYHRYPDSDSTALRKDLSLYTGVKPDNLMVGNGSDELIQYIINTFVGQDDPVLIHWPTFSMYGFFTKLAGGRLVEAFPSNGFEPDIEAMAQTAKHERVKVVFLCNPNNPTGAVIPSVGIRHLLETVQCIVVIDEAYYEYYGQTVINWVDEYPNLIVLRTFSKALALAGLRVGYLATGDGIMGYLSRVKVPYNVDAFSQMVACSVLRQRENLERRMKDFKDARDALVKALQGIDGIDVYPTNANFVLIRLPRASDIRTRLMDRGILVRGFREKGLEDCLRITVGTKAENGEFISQLTDIVGR